MSTEVALDDEPDEVATRTGWAAFAPWIGMALLLAFAACLTVAYVLDRSPVSYNEPVRSTFTDAAGRTCTQVVTGPAVALDCDFPPPENRLGGFLNDLDN